ncbi:MAG TPA: lytic transglycosylase, partial [Candidatus Portnoybacteria bacterium]|nr:lytic transglycosylase [Candidatus Portnoybacteria bacterium]
MNIEKKFNGLNNQNNQPEKKPEKHFDQSEKGLTRRGLLTGLGALGLLGWLGKNKAEKLLSNLLSKSKDGLYSELDLIKKSLSLPPSIDQEKKPISPERKLIEEEDKKSIQEILDFHQKKIHLDATKIKKVESFWEDRYRHYPPLYRSFEKAYFEMGAWEDRLEKIFQKELSGVLPPQQINDLVYLAIPESHWQIYYWQDGSKSSKGAVGPYQIIKSTAREYGLRMNKTIDERRDPELSATACAKIIRDLLHDFDNNLDLAVSGYNGSFVYQYKKVVNGQNMSYENFLSYANQQINQIKENLNHLEYYHYRIQRGDTLRKIALITHTPIQKLAEINNIKNKDTIKIGQKIRIPLRGSAREKIFNYKIRGLEENLVYPAKYKAIIN